MWGERKPGLNLVFTLKTHSFNQHELSFFFFLSGLEQCHTVSFLAPRWKVGIGLCSMSRGSIERCSFSISWFVFKSNPNPYFSRESLWVVCHGYGKPTSWRWQKINISHTTCNFFSFLGLENFPLSPKLSVWLSDTSNQVSTNQTLVI